MTISVPDISNWKEYTNDWYGFQLKYSQEFKSPEIVSGKTEDLWEKKYYFFKNRKKEDFFSGFGVVVYDLKKVKEITATDEFPRKRNEMKEGGFGVCQNIEDTLDEMDNFSAEEIYVPKDNYCYFGAFFFTLVSEDYIFNIIPLTGDGNPEAVLDKGRVVRDFPDFLGVVSGFELRDIKRPIAPSKPKISAPMPVSYKIVNGRLVCDKKNDKPGKSKKNKKKHLDLECCLDPDEYPNPHCYYDPKKYGKYL